VPQTQWLKTTTMYSLTTLKTRVKVSEAMCPGSSSLFPVGLSNLGLHLPHFNLCLCHLMVSPCVFVPSKDSSHIGLRVHPTPIWLHCNWLHLQWDYFQIRSYSNRLGLGFPQILWRDTTCCVGGTGS
jgi:hypothetical protein